MIPLNENLEVKPNDILPYRHEFVNLADYQTKKKIVANIPWCSVSYHRNQEIFDATRLEF